MPEDNPKPGPKPETLRIEEGEVYWKDALKHAMGKPKCEHPSITREVVCGQKTGECVCRDCGVTFTYAEPSESSTQGRNSAGGTRTHTVRIFGGSH